MDDLDHRMVVIQIGIIKYFAQNISYVKLISSMKTTDHLLLQLQKAHAKGLIDSTVCVRHHTPGFVSIRVVFPKTINSTTIIRLRKHIEHTYQDTEASLTIINDDASADANAMKVQMKIRAPKDT